MDRLMAINVLIMIRTDLTPPNPNDDDGNRPLMAFPVESRRRNCVSRVSAVTLHLHPFWTFTVMMRMPKIHDFMSKINIIDRSLGALRAPTSSWRPFRPLDFVLHAHRALRPCDTRVSDWIALLAFG